MAHWKQVQLSGSLPNDWELLQLRGGRPLFINHKTQSTSWVDPRDSVTYPRRDNELPYGWEEFQDPEVGTFFMNHIRKVQTLVDPYTYEDERSQLVEAVATQKAILKDEESQLAHKRTELSSTTLRNGDGRLQDTIDDLCRVVDERRQLLLALEPLLLENTVEGTVTLRDVMEKSLRDLEAARNEYRGAKEEKERLKGEIIALMQEKGVAGEVNMAVLEADPKEIEFENAVLLDNIGDASNENTQMTMSLKRIALQSANSKQLDDIQDLIALKGLLKELHYQSDGDESSWKYTESGREAYRTLRRLREKKASVMDIPFPEKLSFRSKRKIFLFAQQDGQQ